MKSVLAAILTVLLLIHLPQGVLALDVSAQFACVIDAQTGQILYNKNAEKRHSMASTTKIMTALVALEKTGENELVTVSANAAGTEGSSIYLKAGETLPMSDLLYGLMLSSGNDAAIAIAEHVAGSVESFAAMMTKRAREIGAKNTAFQNPNGLDEEGHYTTAYDLALITREALNHPRFAEIVSTKRKNIPASENSVARSFYNHNKLLSLYPGCIGVKTGFTKKTGRCLVSAAQKNHVTLICVTLNAPNDWNDHTVLLNHGFEKTEARPLIVKDMVMKSLPVRNGSSKSLDLLAEEDFYVTNNEAEGLSGFKIDYHLPSHVPAPVSEGVPIGRLQVSYKGKILKKMNLIAGANIDFVPPPAPTFITNFIKITKYFLNFQ